MNAHQIPAPTSADAHADVGAWIDHNATPLSTSPDDHADLAPLRDALAGAEIVGIGGSTYGAHEQFTMTHRLVRYLVTELGFRTVATEEDWDVALALDHYVRTGEGDLDALMKESGVPWRVREMRDAVEWIRDYNTTHDEPVRFVGVGVIDTRAAVYDAVCDYVAAHAPDRLPELRAHLEEIRPRGDDHVRRFITQVTDKQGYVDHARAAQRLVERLPHEVGDAAYELALHHVRQIVAFYEHYAFHLVDDGYRDERMAETLLWWRARTGHRIAYWSTHAHSARADELTVSVPPRGEWVLRSTGAHLRDALGARYVSIGLTCDEGTVNSAWALPPTFSSQPLVVPPAPADFSERPLCAHQREQYLLDLRTDDPAPRPWLDAAAKTRIIGSIYDPALASGYYMTGGSLAEWFDLVVHQRRVTPTEIL